MNKFLKILSVMMVTGAFTGPVFASNTDVSPEQSKPEVKKEGQAKTKRNPRGRGNRGRGKGEKKFHEQGQSEEKVTKIVNKNDHASTEKTEEEMEDKGSLVHTAGDDKEQDNAGGVFSTLYDYTFGSLVRGASSGYRKSSRAIKNTLTGMGFTGAEPEKFIKMTLNDLIVNLEYSEMQKKPWESVIGLKIKNKTGKQGSPDFFDGWLMVYDVAFGNAQVQNLGPEQGINIIKWDESQKDDLPYSFFKAMSQHDGAGEIEFTLGTPEYLQLNGTRPSALYELISDKGPGTQYVHLYCVRFDASDSGPDVEKLREEALKHREAYVGTKSVKPDTIDNDC